MLTGVVVVALRLSSTTCVNLPVDAFGNVVFQLGVPSAKLRADGRIAADWRVDRSANMGPAGLTRDGLHRACCAGLCSGGRARRGLLRGRPTSQDKRTTPRRLGFRGHGRVRRFGSV